MGCGSKNLTVLYFEGIRKILKVCTRQSFRGISVRTWKTVVLRAIWAEEASLMRI